MSSKHKAPTVHDALQPKQKRKIDAMVDGGENSQQDVDGEQGGVDACAGGQHEHCECVVITA